MKHIRSTLIVDDNIGDIEIAKYYLDTNAHFQHILTASDGKEALELFTNLEASRADLHDAFPPSIVLLDINMPRMNGFQFLDSYQDLIAHIPAHRAPIIIMLTSSQYKEDMAQARSYPIVADFIVKPFTEAHAKSIAAQFAQ